MKGKNLWPGTTFIGEGERDGVELGPHVGNGEAAAEPWRGTNSPIPGRSRTTRSMFKHRLGSLFHRVGPNSLTPLFFYFSNWLRVAKHQNNNS
jgi:hypothetical protein